MHVNYNLSFVGALPRKPAATRVQEFIPIKKKNATVGPRSKPISNKSFPILQFFNLKSKMVLSLTNSEKSLASLPIKWMPSLVRHSRSFGGGSQSKLSGGNSYFANSRTCFILSVALTRDSCGMSNKTTFAPVFFLISAI